MKTRLHLMIAAVLTLLAAGCEEENGNGNGNDNKITGTGPIVTRTLELSSFDKIENTGVADFYITIGSPQSVVLQAQQNIMDVMTWEVVGQTLKVGLEENVSIETQEEIRFDITVPSFTSINLVGVGNFVLSGDKQDELSINLTGVGNVLAYEMEVGSCNIVSTGVGNCQVYVTDNLTVLISGVGNVYYKGDPSVSVTLSGVGQLIKVDT